MQNTGHVTEMKKKLFTIITIKLVSNMQNTGHVTEMKKKIVYM